MQNQWPYATAEFTPVPGTIKADYEDFRVEEIPAYEPSGEGTHVYFRVEKSGLSTGRAINDIAKALGVRTRDIGYAGMKDARGITVQTMSLEHIESNRIANLDIPRIKILDVNLHKNKFKIGHLKGNKFQIKLRDTDVSRLEDVRKMIDILVTRGVPNYFGTQRFGNRGDTWKVGKAILQGDYDEAVAVIAGNAGPEDSGAVLEARELFDKGEYALATRAWPRGFRECEKVCFAMSAPDVDPKNVVLGLGNKTLKLYVSAYQSLLFNAFLARRMDRYDEIENGDLAWKHINGAAFTVEDANVESPRAKEFEISASGPMFGPKMTLPKQAAFELEEEILKTEGITRELFAQKGPLKSPGGRRPLRFQPADFTCDAGEDERGSYLEFRFALQPGCYATSLFREICKDALQTVY